MMMSFFNWLNISGLSGLIERISQLSMNGSNNLMKAPKSRLMSARNSLLQHLHIYADHISNSQDRVNNVPNNITPVVIHAKSSAASDLYLLSACRLTT